ncbi:mitochondrial 2-methylisocitrate lyase [Ciborinia camelliae]|nr:mitochondrial 2-methylisocitrate lyase [Ciborinia camelliae]
MESQFGDFIAEQSTFPTAPPSPAPSSCYGWCYYCCGIARVDGVDHWSERHPSHYQQHQQQLDGISFAENGAAAVHFEDQMHGGKKCGHLAGKVLVPVARSVAHSALLAGADSAGALGDAQAVCPGSMEPDEAHGKDEAGALEAELMITQSTAGVTRCG